MALVRLRPSSKGITVLIILAVVIFFGCVLAYLAAAGKLRAIATELRDRQKQMEDAVKIARTLEQSRLCYLDTRAQIRCLESSVSTQAYVPTLLKQLEQLGHSVNLRVVSVRPQVAPVGAPTRKLSSGAEASRGNVEAASQQKTGPGPAQQAQAPKPYDELKIELELEGSYSSALDFLHGLTNFPKIVAVDSMELSPAGPTVAFKSPVLDIRAKITAFVLKDDGPAVEPGLVEPSARSTAGPGPERT